MVFSSDEDCITYFFADPRTPVADHLRDGQASVLYLLRRELTETLGYDPNLHSEADVDAGGSQHRLFASVILMFTVVDLLAKFMLGDKGGVAARFKQFLRSPDGGGVIEDEAELFWAWRNSLVHAFGSPDPDALAKLGLQHVALGQRREWSDRGAHGLVTVERAGDTAVLYVDGLYRVVITAINHYYESLYGAGSSAARAAFLAAFDRFGQIGLVTVHS